MQNPFIKWFASVLLFCIFPFFLFCEHIEDWLWEGDTSLVLSHSIPENPVLITGQLQKHLVQEENPSQDPLYCWVLKMDPPSCVIAWTTPVHAAFQSPESIRACYNCDELELTGDYKEEWLASHIGETITLSGYLWHAHTVHHLTPVLMDTDPWFKDLR